MAAGVVRGGRMTKNQIDFLYGFTKEEIICWIRKHSWLRKPKKSEMLYIRWDIETEKLRQKEDKHLEFCQSIDWAQRDEYARQFNAETDINKKLALLEKMQPYHDYLDAQMAGYKALDRQRDKLDKLYQSIDKARDKEA